MMPRTERSGVWGCDFNRIKLMLSEANGIENNSCKAENWRYYRFAR